MDDDLYAPVVPEGQPANAVDQDSSSISSSQMIEPPSRQQKKISLRSGNNGQRKAANEDDEAVAIASPNRRSHASNQGNVFQMSAPKIIR